MFAYIVPEVLFFRSVLWVSEATITPPNYVGFVKTTSNCVNEGNTHIEPQQGSREGTEQ